MVQVRGLGRGLGSLIPKKIAKEPDREETKTRAALPAAETAIASPSGVPLVIPIERVLPNPYQPREHFSHDELEELIASIKSHGILQPLIVTEKIDGTYELIAGERRLRAARLAGLTAVPVFIRGAEERDKLELALIENIQRQDLNPIEEARAYRRLLDEYNLTQEEVALRVGKSRPQIANTVRLLELPPEVQAALAAGKVTASAARSMLALGSREEQLDWWHKAVSEKLTVRDIEEAARRVRGPRQVNIPDANLEADEAAMRGILGTKVSVKKRGEAGQILLHFFSNEEYRSLVERLSK
jgi:ParB family chromosome partitioning protein